MVPEPMVRNTCHAHVDPVNTQGYLEPFVNITPEKFQPIVLSGTNDLSQSE